MAITITLSFNDDLSRRLADKVDILDRAELRSYLMFLIEKDVEAKK